jgi:predicted dehydrogenase
VIVAAADRDRSRITVAACEAGKDVYVETPVSCTIAGGRRMVDAARRYGRIVQAAAPRRSAPHSQDVRRILQTGQLGTVRFVRIAQPGGFDAVHHALGVTAPRSVYADGQRRVYDYDTFVLTYGPDNRDIRGEAYYGACATLFCGHDAYRIFPGASVSRSTKTAADLALLDLSGFVDAVRTRRRPGGDIESAHQANTAFLLGTLADRAGNKLHWDSLREIATTGPA